VSGSTWKSESHVSSREQIKPLNHEAYEKAYAKGDIITGHMYIHWNKRAPVSVKHHSHRSEISDFCQNITHDTRLKPTHQQLPRQNHIFENILPHSY